MENTEEWLEQWVDENLNTPQYYEDPDAMSEYASACQSDAKNAGIDRENLEEASGGDLKKYLLDRQNAFTDSEVKRRSASDKY